MKEKVATKNGSQIVTEKLDKNNFPVWKFIMTNFLMRKGYWDYIEGDLEEAPEIPEENATAAQIRCLETYRMLCFQKMLGTVW